MRPPARPGVGVAVAAAALVAATPALGAVTAPPLLEMPAYTQPTVYTSSSGSGLQVTARWAAPTFAPENDLNAVMAKHIEVGGGGAGGTLTLFGASARTDASSGWSVRDGGTYVVQMAACQASSQAIGCSASPAITQVIRVDGTAPTGTVRINGGAAATNNRAVSLELTATDPLIDGIPGSAGGVTAMAVDQDGDGTFACGSIFSPGADNSGCAQGIATTATATLGDGDGVKTVGVRYADAARQSVTPCRNPRFCLRIVDLGTLEGNVSATATDTIILDTAAPVAVVTQNRFTVATGGAVTVNADASTDPGGAPAGVDTATARWDFGDGTPAVTGAQATHTYAQPGTFTGSLTVRDRAGNTSTPRTFAVTVTPASTGTTGAGAVGAVSSTGAFTLTGLRTTAGYRRSRLVGGLRLTGTTTAAGILEAALAPRTGASRVLRTAVPAGPFDTTLALPAGLLPGTYGLTITAPGGSARSTLTLTAPREGVIRTATLRVRASAVTARFTLAARPVTALRRRLTVRITLGGRTLATLPATLTHQTITVRTPALRLTAGTLTATLRAGTTVVGTASLRVR